MTPYTNKTNNAVNNYIIVVILALYRRLAKQYGNVMQYAQHETM